ncbi:hypothetical protein BAUCODRAFT_32316 [Baudoinia panamericana UAMH 10762]|uniref:Peroxin 11C n=1 Tax=Baudoinia panamericana (strain UAMH 10762) TaxID=717646 RepID=M2LUM7_BAUPA|nr:uncharacterized protein BAUCODRAFT_32316 [Baudoinia panamericana UAMH 10762]EMC98297.1 hypothetical protein BAUCODRAFT_32316 [Baudoinia panamericana UAMH 10762]
MAQRRLGMMRNATALAGQRIDSFLTRLHRTLSKTAGAEAILYTLCFTLIFVHARLRHTLNRQYDRLAFAVATNAPSPLLPGDTMLAIIEQPYTHPSELSAGVKAAAGLVEDFLVFSRLRGLISIYSWAREHYMTPPGDAILKLLVWAQLAASTTFQFLENALYLASKGVLRGKAWEERQPRWWVWSNRFWLVHVLLEGLRLLRVRQLRYNEDFGAKVLPPGSQQFDSDSTGVVAQSEELKRKWQRDFYANAGWFPLTLHWSFYDENNSPLNDTWVGLCGLVPGVIALREAWEEAKQ